MFDLYTIIFHLSGLILLVSVLLFLVKIPLGFSSLAQLRERGSDINFGPVGDFGARWGAQAPSKSSSLLATCSAVGNGRLMWQIGPRPCRVDSPSNLQARHKPSDRRSRRPNPSSRLLEGSNLEVTTTMRRRLLVEGATLASPSRGYALEEYVRMPRRMICTNA